MKEKIKIVIDSTTGKKQRKEKNNELRSIHPPFAHTHIRMRTHCDLPKEVDLVT